MRLLSKIKIFLDKHIDLLVYIFVAAYTLLALSVSLGRFWQFQNFYYDLGIFDTAIWKVAHFQMPLINHVNFAGVDRLIFADHFNPSIFLLSPLFWITDRTEILLIIQVLSVSGAAIIGYRMARKILKSKIAILSLVVAFLGFVGMQNALISDFHEATIAVLFLMLIFWAVFEKKWGWYFVFLIILLGLKESFAGLGIGIGLMLLLRKSNWKVALSTIAVSFAWGYVSIKYVIPYFSGGAYYFAPEALPKNITEFISAFITPPIKIKTIGYSFATFGFLPIFDISVLPAIFENFLERFVLSTYKGTDLGMHYSATLSPLMFMGAIRVLEFFEKKKKLKSLSTIFGILIILIVVVLHRFVLRGPLALGYNPAFYKQFADSTYINDLLKVAPSKGLVMTQNSLAPRFTHGRVMLLTSDYSKYAPEVVALNLVQGQSPNSFYPLGYEEATALKDKLLKDANYNVKLVHKDLYLFTRINKYE